MVYNIIGYDNQIIGQVEASDTIEAWGEAGKRFSNILDVRLSEEPIEYTQEDETAYYYKEKGFRIVHAKAKGNVGTKPDMEINIRVRVEGMPRYGDWEWDLEQAIKEELEQNFDHVVSYRSEVKEVK